MNICLSNSQNGEMPTLNVKYILISTMVGIINAVFCYNERISAVIVIVQMAWLLFYLIKGDLFSYTVYYLIFLSCCLEFSEYYGAEPIFGFRETRIGGIGIGTIAIIPLVIVSIVKGKIVINGEDKTDILQWFARKIYILVGIGLVIGAFHIVINDNNVNGIHNAWGAFFGEVYNFIILLVFPMLSFKHIILRYPERKGELRSALLSILIGLVITQVFSFLTPFKGISWESTTLLVSFVSFYIPCLVCFSFYYESINTKTFLFILGVIGLVLSTFYTVTSGGLLVVFFIPVLTLIILKQKGKSISLIFWITVVISIAVIGMIMMKTILSNASILFEYKLSQVLSLLKFWEPNWYSLLPASAKFRFQELGNIIEEYIHKPYTVFFGKGIMGTCLDYNNAFFATNYVGQAAFSEFEWKVKAFFSMHESLNVIFLTSGIWGLSFFFGVIKRCIKYLSKSPFLVVGLIYILFHFTYSFTASNYGLMCLLVGFHDLTKTEMEYICQ